MYFCNRFSNPPFFFFKFRNKNLNLHIHIRPWICFIGALPFAKGAQGQWNSSLHFCFVKNFVFRTLSSIFHFFWPFLSIRLLVCPSLPGPAVLHSSLSRGHVVIWRWEEFWTTCHLSCGNFDCATWCVFRSCWRGFYTRNSKFILMLRLHSENVIYGVRVSTCQSRFSGHGPDRFSLL